MREFEIIKAIAKDGQIKVEFRDVSGRKFLDPNANFCDQGKVIFLSKNHSNPIYSRAEGDLSAAYFLFHKKEISKLIKQKYDLQPNEACMLDLFERIRVSINISNQYLGIKKNISNLISSESDLLAAIQNNPALPIDFIALIKQYFVLDIDLPKHFQPCSKLISVLHDQDEFANIVAGLILDLRIKQEDQQQGQRQENDKGDVDFGVENVDKESESDHFSSESQKQEEKEVEREFLNGALEPIFSDGGNAGIGDELKSELAKIKNQSDFPLENEVIEFRKGYQIFTSKFDEVIFPEKLILSSELESLREQLDLKMKKLGNTSKKITAKLKKKLLANKNLPSKKGQSAGIIDRKKFSQMVADPMIEDIWIDHSFVNKYDTAITILLDNSGSMRGSPIVMSALACEIIANILEKFSIKTEIIGFTTADWRGGRARKLWESSGRPANPGRLNELRHIIYKSFLQKFKKAKVNLGLMLREGVLKENIDGEAILFAHSRLIQQSEQRKIMLVISDGTPIDDSTISANDPNILSDHLRLVVRKIEKEKNIEILAIGIGHIAKDFYRNSLTVRNSSELGDAMINKICELL